MTTRERDEREKSQEAFRLTPGQMDFAVRCVSEWIDLSGNCPSSADADHSSLLRRLLSGREALDNAPPKRFASPDYELGEGRPVKIVFGAKDTDLFKMCGTAKKQGDRPDNIIANLGGRQQVNIDHCSLWCWHDKENGLLMHLPDGDIYRLDGDILQKVASAAAKPVMDGTATVEQKKK